MTAQIHPSAIISPGAQIGAQCQIGPYSVIGPQVVLGEHSWVGSHVVIEGRTRIGKANRIFQFASVGAPPQDLKYRGEESELHIGDENIIREYVTLQPGTAGGGMLTSIGNSNLFMACAHVGHDSKIGNGNVVANAAAVAGHVTIGNFVTVGGLAGIHQFARIGDFALLSAGAMVSLDIPPYCTAQGDRAALVGVNVVGLERRGFSEQAVAAIKRLYRALFLREGNLREKLPILRQEFAAHAQALALIEFIEASSRGVAAARKRRAEEE